MMDTHRALIAVAAGLGVGLVALLVLSRINAAAAGRAAGQAVTDAVGGVVVGIGTGIGIPATDATQCDLDMAAGRTWGASFSCPAGTFLNYLKG